MPDATKNLLLVVVAVAVAWGASSPVVRVEAQDFDRSAASADTIPDSVEADTGSAPPERGAKPALRTAIAKITAKERLTIPPGSAFDEALKCLALNIYHEARSEPEIGQMAVAAVTLNRVRSASFPGSVCHVVKQGGQKRNRCQFSWWCDGRSDHPTEDEAWEKAVHLGRLSLLGLAEDPTRGALYYHANYVQPRWSRSFERTAKIGRHVFYRPKGQERLQVASLEGEADG